MNKTSSSPSSIPLHSTAQNIIPCQDVNLSPLSPPPATLPYLHLHKLNHRSCLQREESRSHSIAYSLETWDVS